jgi:hypothetical protein
MLEEEIAGRVARDQALRWWVFPELHHYFLLKSYLLKQSCFGCSFQMLQNFNLLRIMSSDDWRV